MWNNHPLVNPYFGVPSGYQGLTHTHFVFCDQAPLWTCVHATQYLVLALCVTKKPRANNREDVQYMRAVIVRKNAGGLLLRLHNITASQDIEGPH